MEIKISKIIYRRNYSQSIGLDDVHIQYVKRCTFTENIITSFRWRNLFETLSKSQQKLVRKNSKLRRKQESLIIRQEDSGSNEYPSEIENIPDFEFKGTFERFINIFYQFADSRGGS